MKIAVEGCAHGELDKIYETIEYIQKREKIKIDLLICCGDFQSVRDKNDMLSMAVPPKYREMKDFSEYYYGVKKAPVLTLFIGGNHESANYLWELPYGGWVAENIYYLGYAGVLNFAGLRIGGISGIFKLRDYPKPHFEKPPFTEDTKRSFYHVRNCDVAKMKLLNEISFDICLSHDWPKNIYNYGDAEQLMRFKPFLREEIENGSLGSNAAEELLKELKPSYWFSGHMHAKFSALVPHGDGRATRFLALDKCLPKRNFLQIIDIPDATEDRDLKYDPYWLCVLKSTNVASLSRSFCLELPETLKPSEFDVKIFVEENPELNVCAFAKSEGGRNPQTTEFCSRFELNDPCAGAVSAATNSIKQFTPLQAQRNQSTPRSKIQLPTPSKSSTDDDEFKNLSPTKKLFPKIMDDEDEFSELTNPNASSNPDEINITDDESSSDSFDNEEDTNKPIVAKTVGIRTPVDCKTLSRTGSLNTSFPSFVETPVRCENNSVPNEVNSSETSFSEHVGESLASSSVPSTDSTSSAPSPKKKIKIVRRNQELYTPSKDDE